MAKVYFHGEMTMLKGYVAIECMLPILCCFFKYRKLLICQYW